MSQENKPRRQELITKYYCSGTEDESPVKKNPAKTTKASKIPRKRKVKQNPKPPLVPEPKSPVLREWLKKGSKPANPATTKETTPKKPKKKMNMLKRNDSFEEMCRENDRRMKSLLRTVVEHQRHKKCMDEIRELEKRIDTYVPAEIQKVVAEKPLDCCDMTHEEIREAFHTNMEYLSDIMDERVPNRRHNLFQSKQRGALKSLRYNVSMIAFTDHHKRYLANKLSKYFDKNGDSYYFIVLLPELCLKIFMDRHDMTYDEAYKYLDEASFVDDD